MIVRSPLILPTPSKQSLSSGIAAGSRGQASSPWGCPCFERGQSCVLTSLATFLDCWHTDPVIPSQTIRRLVHHPLTCSTPACPCSSWGCRPGRIPVQTGMLCWTERLYQSTHFSVFSWFFTSFWWALLCSAVRQQPLCFWFIERKISVPGLNPLASLLSSFLDWGFLVRYLTI